MKVGKGKKGCYGGDNNRKGKVRKKFVDHMNAMKKGGMKAPIKDTMPADGQSDSEDM